MLMSERLVSWTFRYVLGFSFFRILNKLSMSSWLDIRCRNLQECRFCRMRGSRTLIFFFSVLILSLHVCNIFPLLEKLICLGLPTYLNAGGDLHNLVIIPFVSFFLAVFVSTHLWSYVYIISFLKILDIYIFFFLFM